MREAHRDFCVLVFASGGYLLVVVKLFYFSNAVFLLVYAARDLATASDFYFTRRRLLAFLSGKVIYYNVFMDDL